MSQLAEKVAKLANKSHKDRVNEFNSKLEALSEHHDIPKVCFSLDNGAFGLTYNMYRLDQVNILCIHLASYLVVSVLQCHPFAVVLCTDRV